MNTIFVFGSNLRGIHGAGAAQTGPASYLATCQASSDFTTLGSSPSARKSQSQRGLSERPRLTQNVGRAMLQEQLTGVDYVGQGS